MMILDVKLVCGERQITTLGLRKMKNDRIWVERKEYARTKLGGMNGNKKALDYVGCFGPACGWGCSLVRCRNEH